MTRNKSTQFRDREIYTGLFYNPRWQFEQHIEEVSFQAKLLAWIQVHGLPSRPYVASLCVQGSLCFAGLTPARKAPSQRTSKCVPALSSRVSWDVQQAWRKMPRKQPGMKRLACSVAATCVAGGIGVWAEERGLVLRFAVSPVELSTLPGEASAICIC